MLFVCDIGNSTIKSGLFAGDKLLFRVDLSSELRTVDEMAITISGAFAMHGIDPANVDNAVIASVVRPLTRVAAAAIELLMQVKPLIVGPGVKSGLNIKTEIPSQLGADIVASAVGAQLIDPRPQIILSMGTATTLTSINEQGELYGVMIAPGIGISLGSLSDKAAELPQVALSEPAALLGRNTVDSMISGIIYGNASMLDGLLDRIAAEFLQDRLEVVATGAYAQVIIPHMLSNHHIRYEANLTLMGLKRIHQINFKRN